MIHLEAGLYRSPRPRRTKPGGQDDVDLERISFKGSLDSLHHYADAIYATHRKPRWINGESSFDIALIIAKQSASREDDSNCWFMTFVLCGKGRRSAPFFLFVNLGF